MTFSLTARCTKTGMFGIAISSSSPAVAARCVHARPMVGTLGIHATCTGDGAVAAGNLLATDQVPAAMIAAYRATSGALAERLLSGLQAGLDQGGEAGPVHSAGLYVVRDVSWPIVDLRIDWSDRPIAALHELWAVYAPQIEDYVRRARQPVDAPGFGVAGEA